MPSQFIFTVCQAGAEAALKQEVARRHPSFRFAFSRQGFVTFRIPEEGARDSKLELGCAFARTWGYSLGKVSGADDRSSARALWKALVEEAPVADVAQFRHLHVWQRERELPGDAGFDPGVAAAANAIGAVIVAQRPESAAPWAPSLNVDARVDDRVLDCVVVEPNEWWFGWHRARSMETRWPGGVPSLSAPPNMISRAYLKLAEALLWSELPVRADDRCVEIGSAPGGSCQLLLERGCIVTGIDPAEMDPIVLANPRFTHIRARSKDVDRQVFRDCRWLIADMNVPPKYTLDAIEPIVAEPGARIAGLVLTLKLTDAALAAALPTFNKRVRSWGYRHVRARQLAFNRHEVCVVASERSP